MTLSVTKGKTAENPLASPAATPNRTTISACMATPLGQLCIDANAAGISAIYFTKAPPAALATTTATALAPVRDGALTKQTSDAAAPLPATLPPEQRSQHYLAQAVTQLSEYFAGSRTQFSLVLAAEGTKFQQQVWQALQHIPYANSCSYAVIADFIQNPKAVRAVGAANGRNPLAIVVPCHRVIGNNGSLTGYAGGLARKVWLLQHEQRIASNDIK